MREFYELQVEQDVFVYEAFARFLDKIRFFHHMQQSPDCVKDENKFNIVVTKL